MPKRKIIHITGHRSVESYFPPIDTDAYYLAGWSSLTARITRKKTTAYEIEIWRPETDVTKPVSRIVEGITCRLFPSRERYSFLPLPRIMVKYLHREKRENQILLHLSGIYNRRTYYLAWIFRTLPIVAQHHGGSSALCKFRRKKTPKSLLMYLFEKTSLRYIDHIFALSEAERKVLTNFVEEKKISLQTMGADFELFKPMHKQEARELLNLPLTKKIILYVGKLYNLKGVNILLNSYKQIWQKCDFQLLLVGASKIDPLYNEAQNLGARIFNYMPHHTLKAFYSAADVYVLPAFHIDYNGGIGVAVIESLACGTPVISTTLKDFPASDRTKVGKVLEHPSQLPQLVLEILENQEDYSNCRSIARKYYDRQFIVKRTVEIYDQLFPAYYTV
ncbi:MAG: glycosyltransferase family 4 protein [Candidatus Hodarchaeota archaeon]